jgi:DNA-binding SARP family transcriptional activator
LRREDRVEFGLLGPLAIRADGAQIAVTAGKQRVLLAALLLRANQVVSADALGDLIWDDSPPGTARVTLQNYVKRLRQVLGPEGPERIVTRPAGYLIELEPGELDVARFGELQAAGRAAARGGAWDSASAQLGAALELWRGQPLANVPSPSLALAELPRLVEMRLETLEDRIEADLHLGRHREVISELQGLIAAEPLRERLHELLMLAWYRSGQRAAALAAYRQARRQLIDEVGIEPGPGLRQLSQQILNADPALLHPASAGDKPPSAGARQRAGHSGTPEFRLSLLPAAVPGFTGRVRELRALSAMPGRPGGPVLITAIGGTAGVGKTALAVHWARQHAARFPGGQLYVNLRGFGPGDPVPPAEALRGFLDALQVPADEIPATLDGRQALFRSLVAGKKILVLLDNARDPAQVRPLLPATASALVLVTSRNQLTDLITQDGAGQIDLDVLAAADARQLLAGRLGPARVAAEPAAADELIGLCARLPLALAITAARAAAHPGFSLGVLAGELRDARGRLDALSTGEDTADVRAVFSWSYANLPVPAARMFRLLGLHPGPDITAQAAASLADLTVPEARRLLRDLTRGHLLTEHSPGRYAFHDLLRAYAAEQAGAIDTEAGRQAARRRMLDHYLHTAHAAALLLRPTRKPVILSPAPSAVTPQRLASHAQALAWFEAECSVLLSAAPLAAEAGLDVHAWQLPWAMTDFLDGRGRWHEQAAIERGALAAVTRLGDTAGQAVIRHALAATCTRLGHHDQAHGHLTGCLELYRQLGDRIGEAQVQQTISAVCQRQRSPADALRHAEQALALVRSVGDRARQAGALNDVGWCHAQLGHYEQARQLCRQALALMREFGNRSGEAVVWDSLGYAEHNLGYLTEAADCYQHSLDLFRELGQRFLEASVLTHLGDTHEAADDQPRAGDAWQQALAILDDLRHPDASQVRGKLRQRDGARPADVQVIALAAPGRD